MKLDDLGSFVDEEMVVIKTNSSLDSALSCPAPSAADLQAAIRRRAEEIYIQSGRIPGRDLDNWTQAEMDVLHEAKRSPRSMAVVVKVNGAQYVGEYDGESCDGYCPGEFGPGTSVPVRFDGDKMFVKRANGKELETTIVRRIG